MAGSIKADTNKQFSSKDTALNDITEMHTGSALPKFGGEYEIFLTAQDEDGSFMPISYDCADNRNGTGAIINRLIKDHNYRPLKQVEHRVILLEGTDNSIISFEKYASVMERADKAYGGLQGLTQFADSIDAFAGQIESLTQEFNMKASPFDFDVFCAKEKFTADKEAPSERFGESGMLGHYDNDHPLIDDIDRRTTSGHFSVGYEDRDHLWRMAKVLTKLTPALYAAFAASPPTHLVEINGQKNLLSTRELNDLKATGLEPVTTKPVLVPRALAWTIADKNRTGLPHEMIDLSFEENSSFKDYVDMMCNKADIIHTAYDEEQSFLQTLEAKAKDKTGQPLTLNDYIAHIGTIWHDFRADTVRLESRMPGNSVWKSKAVGALLVGALQNKNGLAQTEKYLDSLTVTPATLKEARDEIGFSGLNTSISEDGLLVKDMLQQVVDIARQNLAAEHAPFLEPLEKVLQSGISDSDFLKMIEDQVNGDYSGFLDLKLTETKPFIQMYEEGTLSDILPHSLVKTGQNNIQMATAKGASPS